MLKILRAKLVHPSGKGVTLEPVWPNEGVRAWYESQLDALISEMYVSARTMLLPAVREVPVVIAADEAVEIPNAAGIIFVADHRILLLKRNDTYQQWALPGGGLEKYETAEQAARREVWEELGLRHIQPMEFLHMQHYRNIRFATFVSEGDAFIPTLNHEHTAYKWMRPRDALQTLDLHPGVRATLISWLEGIDGNKFAEDANTPVTRLSKEIDKWGRKWVTRFDLMSKNLSLAFTNRNAQATQAGMMSAFKKAGFTVAFKPTRTMLEAYRVVAAEQVGLIKSIPQKFISDVQTQVWEAVKRGGDLQRLSQGLEKTYGITRKRAALIARDQNAKAKEVLEDARLKELGLRQGIWMHSRAGKEPRPTHVKMNNKLYELSKGMYDSDEGRYVLPGELINCRCTKRVYIPGFDDIRPEFGLVQT